MYRLKKKNPPFGTAVAPIWEYAYAEQVKVVEGFCDAQNASTRDYLVKLGYEEIDNGEPVPVGIGANGHSSDGYEPAGSVPPIQTRPSSRRKKGRH